MTASRFGVFPVFTHFFMDFSACSSSGVGRPRGSGCSRPGAGNSVCTHSYHRPVSATDAIKAHKELGISATHL